MLAKSTFSLYINGVDRRKLLAAIRTLSQYEAYRDCIIDSQQLDDDCDPDGTISCHVNITCLKELVSLIPAVGKCRPNMACYLGVGISISSVGANATLKWSAQDEDYESQIYLRPVDPHEMIAQCERIEIAVLKIREYHATL